MHGKIDCAHKNAASHPLQFRLNKIIRINEGTLSDISKHCQYA